MRAFLDIVRFELRIQTTSPVFVGLALLYFLLHLLTLSQVGIHLTDNERIAANSAYLLVRTAMVLGVLGPLPAIFLVAHAIVRDHERHTAETFFTTPASSRAFLAGRFVGGFMCVALVGAAGAAGLALAAWMPWISAARLTPTSYLALGLTFVVMLPSLFTYCAFSFAVAERARSITVAWVVAPVIVVLALAINGMPVRGDAGWPALLDPSGLLAVETATRYWSVADLNARSPFAPIVLNRLIWIGASLVVVLYTVLRGQLMRVGSESVPSLRRLVNRATRAWTPRDTRTSESRTRGHVATPRPAATEHDTRERLEAASGWPNAISQFASQLRIDLRAAFVSPLTVVVIVLTVVATVNEARTIPGAVMGLPLHPQTGQMLGFFRFGLFQFALMQLIFYSGTLVHRERDYRIAEIVDALPHPDWLMVMSKTTALCLLIASLLMASVLSTIVLQVAAGYRHFDVAVYAEGVFLDTGVYFGMLAVLAVFIQVLSPGKWTGMLATVVAFAILLSLEQAGFEDLLYGFRLPQVIYSDMNGFGHYRLQLFSLVAYWVAFCLLLLAAAHLLYLRGPVALFAARLREGRRRVSPPVRATVALTGLALCVAGAWIFINTHVLNAYTTDDSRKAAQAEYERRYGQYRNQPMPSLTRLDFEVDLFPSERRLESRGTATLINRRDTAVDSVVISADPRLSFSELTVAGSAAASLDTAQGVFRFTFIPPLAPQATTVLSWRATRANRGFANSANDNEIVGNGTFVDLAGVAPLTGYDEECELSGAVDRRRFGLPLESRLAALGDPAWLATVGRSNDGRVDMHVIVSTDGDQTPVSGGRILRSWDANGRRLVEFTTEAATWPTLAILSARYDVAKRTTGGVSLEVYHDPQHGWNVPIMLDTADKALAYFSREFRPYPLSSLRIAEYARYRGAARSFPGAVAYSETAGFLTDLTNWAQLDYTTIHEFAHQWWGGLAYGAHMQGRQMLNESLAQYSTLMMFKQFSEPRWLREVLATTHDAYLNARSRESVDEQPLMRTEDQGNISYNKGALALFALQDIIGADKVHAALRAYLDRFAMKPPPFPTSRDLVNELRAVAGPDNQSLITDLFEKIVVFDVGIDSATMQPTPPTDSAGAALNGFDVTVDVSAHRFEVDGQGTETEGPLDAWFDIVIFPESSEPRLAQAPLYQGKHRLRRGVQRVTVHVDGKPGAAGVDPYHVMIDRTPGNNIASVALRP